MEENHLLQDRLKPYFSKSSLSLNGFETPYSLASFASNQECLFLPCFFSNNIQTHSYQ
jgi:hypothetical protein